MLTIVYPARSAVDPKLIEEAFEALSHRPLGRMAVGMQLAIHPHHLSHGITEGKSELPTPRGELRVVCTSCKDSSGDHAHARPRNPAAARSGDRFPIDPLAQCMQRRLDLCLILRPRLDALE
mmetsp:Transcript_7256/g.14833  ORF Transcript_7256/g.14833 Transcript_7256/m.14833 type:complete len:122 (-) Transcript_7256:43-408(-)